MKTLKYFLSTFLVIAVIWSCTKDKLNNLDFTNSAVAPSNVTLLLNVTQDNTGLVSMTPNSVGAISYSITFGDETTEPIIVKQGKTIEHIYSEGSYNISIVAVGVTGLKTEFQQPILVSFQAPIFGTEPIIENDTEVSKKVNVTVPNDTQFAMVFDVYFVEDGIETIITGNVGETVSYTYTNAGLVDIKVVLKGGAIETVEFIKTDFEVTAILAPLVSATIPTARGAVDVISIYGDAYTNVAGTNYNPDWGQSGQGSSFAEFDLNGDKMLQYINLSYQGIGIGETVDVSGMEYLHMDVWTAGVTVLETSLINGVDGNSTEAPVLRDLTADEWTSIDIPISEYTNQGLTVDQIFQLKLVGTPWAEGTVFVDNIYFYKAPTVTSSILDGTWKLAPEAGALKVGPSAGNGDWWTSDAQAVIDRACFFDDTYVFNSDGSFSNVLGADTWLEAWQGMADACGTPLAPYDGTANATYSYDVAAGTVTINGTGAYLGIPKANNAGELPNVAVPSSIIYNITLSDNDNTMDLVIEAGAGVFWSFKLVRNGVVAPPPVEGTWKIAPEAGALKVGPSAGNGDWWTSSADDVTTRACFFDDTYVFNSDGSFSNILGADTWLEAWQVTADACGTPLTPYDGTASATYSYDVAVGTITINGTGAYLGIPKANNAGELPNVAVPSSITYNIALSNNNNTMDLVIEAGAGVFWSFKLVKQGTSSGGGTGTGGGSGSTGNYNLTLPIDFESTGFGANWSWNVFENDSNPALEFVANPSTSGINASSTVAKITALQAGQPWVGTETAHGEMGITWDLSASNAIIKIMVYKTVISDIGIKLVNPAGGAQGEIKVANTKINEWEELTFDFSGRIGNGLDGSTNIDQIVVFPDFNTRTSDNAVYFDNITFQ